MISLLIPTRQRRAGLETAIQSALDTASHPENLEFVAYVDDDDAATYRDFAIKTTFVQGPRIILSNMWNKCAAAATGDIFMQGNDDIVFRTRGWDVSVESAFKEWPDRIGIVHGSDGGAGASGKGDFGCHPFVHRRWYEILGYFTAPFYSSDYGDTHLNELANAIGRRRFIPFVIEHMHFWFGKMVMDKNSEDRLARHAADNVAKLYRDLAPLREVDIEKLRAAMNEKMADLS